MKKFLFISSFYCLLANQIIFWFVSVPDMLMGRTYNVSLYISGMFAILAIVLGLISQINNPSIKK